MYNHKARKIEELRNKYLKGISWGEAKQELFQAVNAYFKEPRNRYYELMAAPDQIDQIVFEGAKKARAIAAPLLERVKSRIGR